jgi:hypothetical protein
MSSKSLIVSVNKVNKDIINVLERPLIRYPFLIFVIIQIIIIDKFPTSYLEHFDSLWFKIIMAFLIVYYACFDPVYSIALTTLIIVGIQELHRRRASKALLLKPAVSKVTMSNLLMQDKPLIHQIDEKMAEKMAEKMVSQKVKYIEGEVEKREQIYLVNDANTFDEINKQSLQKVPIAGDRLVAEYDFYEDPAYKTITANLSNNQVLGRNKFMVSSSDLEVAQTNKIPNKIIGSAQVFDKAMNNIQGLPMGYEQDKFSRCY